MHAYHCDHFVLPLPDGHRFPMDKYRRLRERVLTDGIVAPAHLRDPEAAPWEMLARIHTPEYLDASVTIHAHTIREAARASRPGL